MKHNEFHNLKEKLYDAQMPLEVDLWQSIEGSMRRRRMRRILYYASSAAAVLLVAVMFLVPGGNKEELQVQTIAQAVEVQEEIIPAVAMADEFVETIQEMEAEERIVHPAISRPDVNGNVNDVVELEEVAEAVEERTEPVQKAAGEEVQIADGAADKVADKAAGDSKTYKYVALLHDEAVDFEDDVRREKRYTIALSQGINPGSTASVAGSRIMASSAFGGAMENSHMVEQVSDVKYSLPVNVGIQLQFPVGRNVALGVGINYSMLKSKYDCLIDKVHYKVKQKLHYVGIPLNVYGLIADKNNFSFYVNAGITLEKGVKAVYKLGSYKESQSYRTDIDGVQFSMNAGLGVEYKFGNAVGLYFEPNLVYYTNSDIMYSIRTDQPFQIKADVGFRFHF